MTNFDPATPDNIDGTTINSEPFSGVRICAPGNLRGWRTSATTAMFSWDEPYATCNLCPDAVGYEVACQGLSTRQINRSPCEVTALNADVEYEFHVTAKAAGNNVSTASIFRLARLQAPNKPGTPELLDLTHASAILHWAPSNPGFEGMRYRVYLNGELIKQVTEPQVSLAHLASFTEFRVEVRAVNAAGISDPSLTVFKTRLSPPRNLRFSQRNGNCRVAWDPDFKKLPAYEVTINGQVFKVAPGRWGYNFKLADLSPGPVPHTFKFAVVAHLDAEHSEASVLECIVEDDVPPGRPGSPVASDITDTGAILSWAPAEDNVGVTGYRVVLNGFLVYSTVGTSFTFNKLTSGAYHYVFVRAMDKEGNLSAGSGITTFKTTGQAPSPRPAAPQAKIVAMTSNSARLEWTYQDDVPVSGVRIMLNGEHLRDILLLNAFRLDNLIPDVEHEISISAFDVYGQLSEPTIILYVPLDVTPPSKPGNLRKVAMSTDSVTLAWDESTDDVGVCDYVIYSNHEYFDRTPMTQYKAVDLLPGTYSFAVCAMDDSGNLSEPAVINLSIEGQL